MVDFLKTHNSYGSEVTFLTIRWFSKSEFHRDLQQPEDRAWSMGAPKRMLSRNVPEKTHGSCGTYPTGRGHVHLVRAP